MTYKMKFWKINQEGYYTAINTTTSLHSKCMFFLYFADSHGTLMT